MYIPFPVVSLGPVVRWTKSRRTDDENRAEKAEAHKQEQLKDVKEGKAQWKDELASDSESIVRSIVLLS